MLYPYVSRSVHTKSNHDKQESHFIISKVKSSTLSTLLYKKRKGMEEDGEKEEKKKKRGTKGYIPSESMRGSILIFTFLLKTHLLFSPHPLIALLLSLFHTYTPQEERKNPENKQFLLLSNN